MEIKLNKKVNGPVIIEGFPGLGLISTISTEYLIKHINAEPIGSIWSEKLTPIVAVHDSKLSQPLELFYSKKYNLLILHALCDVSGMEWEIGEALAKLYKKVNAKEIISIEGIMSQEEKIQPYFLATKSLAKKKMQSVQITPLKEGIIMGVSATLLLHNAKMNRTGIFVGTHSKLPDSRAAAKVIEVLDKYMGLGIDYKPLIKAADEFETKLKEFVNKTKHSLQNKKSRNLDYLG